MKETGLARFGLDTICLSTPIGPILPHSAQYGRKKLDRDGHLKTLELSCKSGISAKLRNVKGIWWLTIRFSSPRVLFDHNAYPLSPRDLRNALGTVVSVLQDRLGPLPCLDRVEDWSLTEAHLTLDLVLENPAEYLESLGKTPYPGRRKKNSLNSTIYLENKSSKILIYDKEAEVASRKGRNATSILEERRAAKSVLRIELQMKRPALRNAAPFPLKKHADLHDLERLFRIFLRQALSIFKWHLPTDPVSVPSHLSAVYRSDKAKRLLKSFECLSKRDWSSNLQLGKKEKVDLNDLARAGIGLGYLPTSTHVSGIAEIINRQICPSSDSSEGLLYDS